MAKFRNARVGVRTNTHCPAYLHHLFTHFKNTQLHKTASTKEQCLHIARQEPGMSIQFPNVYSGPLLHHERHQWSAFHSSPFHANTYPTTPTILYQLTALFQTTKPPHHRPRRPGNPLDTAKLKPVPDRDTGSAGAT